MSDFSPREIVSELDRHIVGQKDAKRAVAIALRNRWRRKNVEDGLQDEILPKNILMIGPTGVGKTEISRRLAKLAGAPFIKVEATKFTEVGYVGREVDSIIKDLTDIAVKQARETAMEKVKFRAEEAAEERVLDALLPSPTGNSDTDDSYQNTRQKLRKKLREGELDDREIEIEVSQTPMGVEIMGPPGMEEMTEQLQGMFQKMGGGRSKRRKLHIKVSFGVLADEGAAKMDNQDRTGGGSWGERWMGDGLYLGVAGSIE